MQAQMKYERSAGATELQGAQGHQGQAERSQQARRSTAGIAPVPLLVVEAER